MSLKTQQKEKHACPLVTRTPQPEPRASVKVFPGCRGGQHVTPLTTPTMFGNELKSQLPANIVFPMSV